jgi:phosphoribosyl-ATP pyrophosphohydrolase
VVLDLCSGAVLDRGPPAARVNGDKSTRSGHFDRPAPAEPAPPGEPLHELAIALSRLEDDLARVRAEPKRAPRTAGLLEEGLLKMAKNVGEEAIEPALDGVRRDRHALIGETADLPYHLVVLLDELGIGWAEVADELDRRRARLGIAEQLPKAPAEPTT